MGAPKASDRHRPVNRLERRKHRTRAALIKAAHGFIAVGKVNVSVLEITQAADVGMGSFYNHFDSKEQLFGAALSEIFDAFGSSLDRLPALDDPAEMFARSFRLTVRWLGRRTDEVSVLLNGGIGQLMPGRGLGPSGWREISAATDLGRFQIDDIELAVTLAAEALFALIQLLHDQPERDVALAADRLAQDLLVAYGVSRAEAQELCLRTLPDLDDLMAGGAPDRHDVTVVEMHSDAVIIG
ncbi:MAG: TetR/AcrR family transcriptional regulator [Mycobacterium sp.]|nr:TetR/AcrR family transcriptional regulator [Mycobacterium sp.]